MLKIDLSDRLANSTSGFSRSTVNKRRGCIWLASAYPPVSLEPLLPGWSDGEWLMGKVDEGFVRLADDTRLAVDQRVGEVSAFAGRQFRRSAVAQPERPEHRLRASLGTVQANTQGLSYALLGKACLLVGDDTGLLQEITHPAQNTSPAGQADLQQAAVEAYRRMNTPEGVTAFDLAPETLSGAAYGALAVERGHRLLLVNGGLYRLVTGYGVMSAEAFFAVAFTEGLERLRALLRDQELKEAPSARYPRLLRHEDVAGATITLRRA